MFGRKDSYKNDQSHEHDHQHGIQFHMHGAIDPSIFTTQRGMLAVKWSFFGLLATAILQLVIVIFSGSVALLADTIHNIGDTATAIPLWVAFTLAKRKPTSRFTYGYGRVED
jgi:divalent metal cation (Fe/Co/Zn/Cd) transporter